MSERKIDLFSPVVPANQLHRAFLLIARSASHEPARDTLRAAFDSLPRPDGNFVRDLQTTGFDARIWELYLAAYANSVGLQVRQPHDRPDFLFLRNGERVWVEAVTANPAQGASSPQPQDYWEKQDAVAIKLGSALWSKLNKRYWELPHVQGAPLVLAIADFHDPSPIRQSAEPLKRYLYGSHLQLTSSAGKLVEYRRREFEVLQIGRKAIPAGFFAQPGAEHISAVLFSNAGTVAKFNRMGFSRQRHPHIRMLRSGFAFDPDPTAILPRPFAYIVGERPETWEQEVVVYHNLNARLPVARKFFGGILQYDAGFSPYCSLTRTVSDSADKMPLIEEELRAWGRRWLEHVERQLPELEQGYIASHRSWKEGLRRIRC